MKTVTALAILFLVACNAGETGNDAASPGVLPADNAAGIDTNLLITDSVVIKDSNTADIEPMKKIN